MVLDHYLFIIYRFIQKKLKEDIRLGQGNAIDLADKIIYAMQNSEKMSLIAKNAREYSLQRFSAGRNAREIFDVYETIK